MALELHLKLVLQCGISFAMALLFAVSSCPGQTVAASSRRDTAFALEQQGRNVEAEAAWQKILDNQPNDAEAYAHLGFLESRQQHYSRAVVFYRKALALNSSMPGLQLNLGLALFKAGEMKAAIRVFEPLLNRQSPVASVLVRDQQVTVSSSRVLGMSDQAPQNFCCTFRSDETAADFWRKVTIA